MKKTPERPKGESDIFGENLPTEWYTFYNFKETVDAHWQPSERTRYLYNLIQSGEYQKTDECKKGYALLTVKGINRYAIALQKMRMWDEGLIPESDVPWLDLNASCGRDSVGMYENDRAYKRQMRFQHAYKVAGEVYSIARRLPEKNSLNKFASNSTNYYIRNLLKMYSMEELVAVAAVLKENRISEYDMYHKYDRYYGISLSSGRHNLSYYFGYPWKSVDLVQLYLAQLLTVLKYAKTHNP